MRTSRVIVTDELLDDYEELVEQFGEWPERAAARVGASLHTINRALQRRRRARESGAA
jgi:hypothetical protein